MTHYELLGIEPTADVATIADALVQQGTWWRECRHVATDRLERVAAEHMIESLDEARAVLLDPERRAAYDRSLEPAMAGRRPVASRAEPVEPPVRSLRVTMAPDAPDPPLLERPVTALAMAGLVSFLAAMYVGAGGFRTPLNDTFAARVSAPDATAPAIEEAPVTLAPPEAEMPIAEPAPVAEAPPATAAPVPMTYTAFTDDAGGYRAVYPSTFRGQATPNHIGQRFVSPDGRAEIVTVAVPAPVGLEQAYASAASGANREVSYQARGEHWYVVSGYEGDTLFYEKVIAGNGQFKSLRVTVPREERDRYDGVIEQISHGFKSPP